MAVSGMTVPGANHAGQRRGLTLVADPGTPSGSGPTAPVPCAARPSTAFVHRDGPCRCFAGGPAPEFPAVSREP